MNETSIAWTELTWNPWSGCARVTEGCHFCYAETLAENRRGTPAFPNGFELTVRRHKFREPFKLKAPSLVFLNSMSDFFWEEVSDALRDEILEIVTATPQHQYQVLTKRPENMVRYFSTRPVPDNFWAGVTIESARTLGRLALLRTVDAAIRFVSVEPLLSEIRADWSGVQWVIGGGESGTHLTHEKNEPRRLVQPGVVKGRPWDPRPDRLPWAQHLRDDVKRAGAAFFWKQWGGPRPNSGGRELDGRTWDEFPRSPAAGGTWATRAALPVVSERTEP